MNRRPGSWSVPAHRVDLVLSIKQIGVPLGGVMAGALWSVAGGAAPA
ncbi:hypothetical protein [Hydrogenophaga sp.]|nr:hypothetical protein [Hydrogenophaga sp.]MBT9467488.1 hypothetical protein [Hydrogenophaga sp.]MDZ4397201.1 hypothetical protein [Hydrogenophaga sp.]